MSSALPLIVFGQVYFLGPMSNTVSITPNTTLTPTIQQEASQPEPLRGVRRNDYIYTPGIGGHKVHTEVATWNTAREICEQEGGYLAIINSVAESEVIAQLFQASLPHVGSSDSNYVHIGFHDLFKEGEYVTVHGESVKNTGFNEWAFGGPNNYDNDENCGSIYVDGKLNDISCKKSCGFVCELPYAEENLIQPQ